MANKNTNLHNAKKAKNDEFYTQLSDIEKEMAHYKDFFKGKIVYCNCDDARESNFFKFFSNNFESLGLKKLITTGYKAEGKGVKLVYEGDKNGNFMVDDAEVVMTELEGNGDFRSEECIELLKECDVVVTNPPFSLFREYVAQLMEYGKKFLIIGNLNAVTYKEIFPLIKENKVWMGATCFNGGATHFIAPSELYDAEKMSNPKNAYFENSKFMWQINGVRWFTNMEQKKRNEELILYKHYNPIEYQKYDNYNAIEVSKVAEIPMDYEGVCGVPISFLDKYCPTQFEIVGLGKHNNLGMDGGYWLGGYNDATINGKIVYCRILIRKKKAEPIVEAQ